MSEVANLADVRPHVEDFGRFIEVHMPRTEGSLFVRKTDVSLFYSPNEGLFIFTAGSDEPYTIVGKFSKDVYEAIRSALLLSHT